jgi:hypothetical protein
MEETKNNGKAAEPMAMTYGMSDYLINSGLLTQISDLSTRDKQCLISYISEEVEINQQEEDEWDLQDTSNLEPYTLDELYARIEASEEDIRNGRVYTAEESDAMLRKEFLWLQ